MEYVLADRDGGQEAYWFERNLPSLELAERAVKKYPKAKFILEYRQDKASKGVLPTGRNWPVNEQARQ